MPNPYAAPTSPTATDVKPVTRGELILIRAVAAIHIALALLSTGNSLLTLLGSPTAWEPETLGRCFGSLVFLAFAFWVWNGVWQLRRWARFVGILLDIVRVLFTAVGLVREYLIDQNPVAPASLSVVAVEVVLTGVGIGFLVRTRAFDVHK